VGLVEDTKYQDARQPAYATFFLPFLPQIPRNDESAQNAIDGSNGRIAARPQCRFH
jgi:hypothetical protein